MSGTSDDQAHTLVDPADLPEGVTLREHVYDGIQEYDQKLPNWWLSTFYGAIIFFIGYWFSTTSSGIPTPTNNASRPKSGISRKGRPPASRRRLATLSNERLWKMSRDPKMVAAGQATYASTCIACHGADLSGTMGGVKLLGLPLNDAEWKYGGTPMDVFNTVTDGSPDSLKGMQAWEPILGRRQGRRGGRLRHEPPRAAGNEGRGLRAKGGGVPRPSDRGREGHSLFPSPRHRAATLPPRVFS